MSKKLAKLLRTEFSASLPVIAKILESKGRNRDKILAHINEDEAELLRMHGGRGTINPETGLMEFDDGYVPTLDYSGVTGGVSPEAGLGTYTPEQITAGQTYTPSYTPAVDTSSFGGGSGAAAAPAPSLYDRYASPVTTDSIGFQPTGTVGFTVTPELAREAVTPTSLLPTGRDALTVPSPSEYTKAAPAGAEPSGLDKLAKALGISTKELMAGGMGLAGILQGRQVAAQGQQAKKELMARAQPYQQRGQQLLTAAERGELTPVGQQQLQALQARLAQGVEARGGVGVQQAQAQINAYRDQLIQAQYDLGLKVLNVADSIAAGAIKTGLAADQYVNELTNNYMTNVARTLYGAAPQVATTPAA